MVYSFVALLALAYPVPQVAGPEKLVVPEVAGPAAIVEEAPKVAAPEHALSDPWLLPHEERFIELLNVERARHGLSPVAADMNLVCGCRRHCCRLISWRFLQHDKGHYENIAMGYGTPDGTLNQWLNSSGHRAALLNPRIRYVGVAGYSGSRSYWWTSRFR